MTTAGTTPSPFILGWRTVQDDDGAVHAEVLLYDRADVAADYVGGPPPGVEPAHVMDLPTARLVAKELDTTVEQATILEGLAEHVAAAGGDVQLFAEALLKKARDEKFLAAMGGLGNIFGGGRGLFG